MAEGDRRDERHPEEDEQSRTGRGGCSSEFGFGLLYRYQAVRPLRGKLRWAALREARVPVCQSRNDVGDGVGAASQPGGEDDWAWCLGDALAAFRSWASPQ